MVPGEPKQKYLSPGNMETNDKELFLLEFVPWQSRKFLRISLSSSSSSSSYPIYISLLGTGFLSERTRLSCSSHARLVRIGPSHTPLNYFAECAVQLSLRCLSRHKRFYVTNAKWNLSDT